MKGLLSITIFVFCSFSTLGHTGKAYLEKFNSYLNWSQNLPKNPSPDFIKFINQDSPLTNKLRKKWLIQLAKDQKWQDLNRYYQPIIDTSLICQALTAQYQIGNKNKALLEARKLWLSGSSQPKACDELFKNLLNTANDRDQLLTQRIELALAKRNLSLARYLFKQFLPVRTKDIRLLNQIYRNPAIIRKLKTAPLHDDFYLYGLKRMVSIDMKQAITFWQHVKTKKLLTQAQQQAFLSHVALYKAIRNHKDAYQWFKKVKPEYYNDVLIDWQIRFALKNRHWKKVKSLVDDHPEKNQIDLQYWKARALEAQGNKTKADIIYKDISLKRNYYGFLASLRIKQPFHFEQEVPNKNIEVLQAYQMILEKIKNLYQNNQPYKASKLIHEFALELPANEKSALAYWLQQHLNWHSKALYLANNKMLRNQISLRFPTAHNKTVKKYAQIFSLQKALIYAVIRQESTFREKVVSHAGAYGLMQVLPSTAKQIARSKKIQLQNSKQLFQVNKNIEIGSAYLSYLGKKFHHHPVLMAAAYNAGPKQVRYWLKKHPPNEFDIWIETLPWHETRNYLKNVFSFYAVYQHLMGETPNVQQFTRPL